MSARVFPSSEAGQYTMRAAALRSLNTLQKKKKGWKRRIISFTCYGKHNSNNGH